jgi:itaconyl-CoA hydratase
MVAIAREVAPRRWRASAGRYFEDFTIGDIYEHRPGRTIGEADNTWFTLLTMNQHPLHFDAAYAAKSEFGRPVVNSCLTLSIVAGMSVADVSQKAIANLGWDVITVRTTGRKADGTVFISYERTVLVPKQGHAVED